MCSRSRESGDTFTELQPFGFLDCSTPVPLTITFSLSLALSRLFLLYYSLWSIPMTPLALAGPVLVRTHCALHVNPHLASPLSLCSPC